MKIIEDENRKSLISPYYKYYFDKNTGLMIRTGRSLNDDPPFSPFGPEILDFEISSGSDCLGQCPFCYKGNGYGQITYNIPFKHFQNILHKVNENNTLTQIAFGIMNISTHPDFFKILEYTRRQGVIPNYTCHGLDLTEEYAEKTKEFCGAVAVSVVNKEKTYKAVHLLAEKGMKQINIHYMLSQETYDKAFRIVDDIASRKELEKLNAIVFLQYKHKNRNSPHHSINNIDKFKKLVEYCQQKNISFGFDSCSFPLFAKSIENKKNYKSLISMTEPCESSLFSAYINCHGEYFPCSFVENIGEWEHGIPVLECDSFLKDVWMNSKNRQFRNELLNSNKKCFAMCLSKQYCRVCPVYDITPCKQEIHHGN